MIRSVESATTVAGRELLLQILVFVRLEVQTFQILISCSALDSDIALQTLLMSGLDGPGAVYTVMFWYSFEVTSTQGLHASLLLYLVSTHTLIFVY